MSALCRFALANLAVSMLTTAATGIGACFHYWPNWIAFTVIALWIWCMVFFGTKGIGKEQL